MVPLLRASAAWLPIVMSIAYCYHCIFTLLYLTESAHLLFLLLFWIFFSNSHNLKPLFIFILESLPIILFTILVVCILQPNSFFYIFVSFTITIFTINYCSIAALPLPAQPVPNCAASFFLTLSTKNHIIHSTFYLADTWPVPTDCRILSYCLPRTILFLSCRLSPPFHEPITYSFLWVLFFKLFIHPTTLPKSPIITLEFWYWRWLSPWFVFDRPELWLFFLISFSHLFFLISFLSDSSLHSFISYIFVPSSSSHKENSLILISLLQFFVLNHRILFYSILPQVLSTPYAHPLWAAVHQPSLSSHRLFLILFYLHPSRVCSQAVSQAVCIFLLYFIVQFASIQHCSSLQFACWLQSVCSLHFGRSLHCSL